MIRPTQPWPRPTQRCRHALGLDTVHIGIWPNKKFAAACHLCQLRSDSFLTEAKAKQDLWSKTLLAELKEAGLKEPEQFVRLMENPILETHNRYTDNSALGAPYGTTLMNETYKQLQEALVPQTEKPYWIIVSDEGHAKIPLKHFVKAEAEKEAQRLTEKQPGITFTVFEAKSSVFTPKAETKKTEYAEPFQTSYWYSYPYSYVNNTALKGSY